MVRSCLLQDPKIREILGFGGPEQRPEEKLVTVVHSLDLVNCSFLNFMAVVQDDTAKVFVCLRCLAAAPGMQHKSLAENEAGRCDVTDRPTAEKLTF